MSTIKKIMVALDLTEVDGKILKYVGYLKKYLRPEDIYFTHITDKSELPDEVVKELGIELLQLNEEGFKSYVSDLKTADWKHETGSNVHYGVLEGSPFEQLLKFSHVNEVDLLIVGKKRLKNGKGVVPQNLARKTNCHILFVPEDWNEDPIEEVVVPLDFSSHSKMAIEQLIDIFSYQTNIKFLGVHCFGVPIGYYKTGKTKEQFAKIMEGHAHRKFDEFFATFDKPISYTPVYKFDDNNQPSAEIMDAARNHKADLIAIGARGKTNLATMVLGSTTECLLQSEHEIPILVVKKPGENIGFLKALFKMK